MATQVDACRICRSTELLDVLSLGDMPPVNSFLTSAADIARESRHPLALVFCPKCTHVQLTHMLDPKDVFEDYIYFSSMSETIVRHGEALAKRYAQELGLGKNDLVAELASNDGCILKPFKAASRVYGVEPAKNIAEVANREGVPTLAEFFDSRTAAIVKKEQGAAKLIIARNVVAHVPEVVDFIAGAGEWLTDDGILHVEVPYLGEMVRELEFDTIYHEHLSYFSVTALAHLFREAGIVLWDVEEIGLHGGSLIARGKRKGHAPTANVERLLAKERAIGLTTMAPLEKFAEGTRRLKTLIPELLRDLKKTGSVAGYGAAAKGVVLTNYCGIGKDLLDWVADRSPHKQGKMMPGTHLPVVSVDRVLAEQPAHLLVLAWNFFDEIKQQQSAYVAAGGKFVVPVPVPRVA
jgi:C-methyltransferase C-terminal domain/Putative zinc binding domain/Methyltransferase domain